MTASRLQFARDAVRPALKARMLLSGPSGSGKTRTALICAAILADGGDVLMIDTERESALTYADDFTFKHLPWEPPYNPRELAGTILDAGGTFAVVIVDSLSHFWRGDGGTLDIADGKFTGWKDARPAQQDLVDALLRTDAHFIGCSRSKVEHVQELEGGKHVVKKLGMAVIQDDTLEYELNIAVELAMDHTIAVSKSRTVAVPVGRTFKSGHAEDFAALYKGWLAGGEPPAPAQLVETLVARMNALPDAPRTSCKQEFVARFGRPEHLRDSQLDDAEALVAEWESRGSLPDEASSASGNGREEQSPDASPASSIEPATVEPVSSGSAKPDDRILTRRDIATLATKAFPLDDAARGEKTKTRDRLRYAVTYIVTNGERWHLNDLDTGQMSTLATHLEHVIAEKVRFVYDDGGATFTLNDKTVTVPWSTFDEQLAQGELGEGAS